MQFKGHLLLPDQPGPGLPVSLDVADHHLAVESETGGLGAWPLEAVHVRRLRGDVFAMTVGGEELHFVADDTIGFTYSGLPSIEKVSKTNAGSGLRSLFGRFRGEESQVVDPVSAAPPADVASAPAVQPEPPVPEPAEPPRPVEDAEALPEPDQLPQVAEATPPSSAPSPVSTDPQATPAVVEEEAPIIPAISVDPEPESAPSLEEGCPALTADGEPCRSPILTPTGYCHPHDPNREAKTSYELAIEARAKLKREAPARLTRMYAKLERAMRQVERGELEPDKAMAMAQLARTMCAIAELDDPPKSRRTLG